MSSMEGSQSGAEYLCTSCSPSTSAINGLSHESVSSSRILSPEKHATGSWFHGQIDQKEAEMKLVSKPVGSFLIRSQSPIRYFLSVVVEGGTISHIPISLLSHTYFINGDNFSSLAELVRSFCSFGYEPITTACDAFSISAVDDLERWICISPFEGNSNKENEEISATIGDLLTEIGHEGKDDWLYVRNERTEATGYIPMYAVQRLICNDMDVVQLPYFHESFSDDFTQKLIHYDSGSFLLRKSSKGEGSFALMVLTQGEQAQKFLIKRANDEEGGFVLAGRRFPTVSHIIERYNRCPILGSLRLRRAIFSSCFEDSAIVCSSSSVVSSAPASDNERDLDINGLSSIAVVEALRKSREDKLWKKCNILLQDDPQGCHLVIRDVDSSRRVRTVLDLPFCTMYVLDESVFGRDGCVFFSQNDVDHPGAYVCFRPSTVYIEWINLLRPRILGLQQATPPRIVGLEFEVPKQQPASFLQLTIDKFRSDTLKTDHAYSAYASVNGVKVCSTGMFSPLSGRSPVTCVFDATFLIPFIPCTPGLLQLSIVSHHSTGKRVRSFAFSPLIGLAECGTTAIAPPTDGFCLSLSKIIFPVLPLYSYDPFLQWLKSDSSEFLDWASSNMSSQRRQLLCQMLISYLLSEPSLLFQFLETLLSFSLMSSSAENILRQDSFATTFVTQLMRILARAQFEDALEDAGIAGMRTPQANDVDVVVKCIIQQVQVPMVEELLRLCCRVAMKKFPEQPQVMQRVVSAVLVLRFANPLVIGTLGGSPTAHFLAKGVQNAANTAGTSRATEMSAAFELKILYEKICSDYETTSVPQLPLVNAKPCADWLAMSCYLLLQSKNSKNDHPVVPDVISRILVAHS